MHELLETYPNPKLILTGANDEQMVEFGLHDMPYEVFTLKHNPEKSDPAYFKTLLERYELAAGDVVYFEHKMDGVKSAESIGITSWYYDSDKQDLDGLKRFLDENL
jgi:FMN phosphatase YigB (HAD superfamily)